MPAASSFSSICSRLMPFDTMPLSAFILPEKKSVPQRGPLGQRFVGPDVHDGVDGLVVGLLMVGVCAGGRIGGRIVWSRGRAHAARYRAMLTGLS